MIIRSRAPLRLGFAGGGTDVSPYSDTFGGCVLNATIDKYAYVTLAERNDGMIRFEATCQNDAWEENTSPHLELDGNLDLFKGVYNRIITDFNDDKPLSLTLSTFSDAPPGSGLGSSSTLVVAMLQAFVEYLNISLGEYEIAHLAYLIEREDVGLKGGKQDQYAATFGGVNYIEFEKNNRVLVNPLRVKSSIISELETSLLLYFTGISRSSSAIIEDQSSSVDANNPINQGHSALEAMHAVKLETLRMKESLLKGDFNSLSESMRLTWESKKKTSPAIATPLINKVYDSAVEAGAVAGKVSGAGGGGFMMFIVDPPKRANVVRTLDYFGGQTMNCHFTRHGASAWKVQ